MSSLWGAEWDKDIELNLTSAKTKKILNKLSNPKKDVSVEKKISSTKISQYEKIKFIESEVNRILGRYKENTVVLRTKEDFSDYISKAVNNGVIAVDTETNNSLDPLTCKLMGLCIYTPGMRQAYIPVNHINTNTNVLLENQLTTQEIKEELDRLSDTKIIMHNGKFDYQVIKCTCNCVLDIYWDTMIGARILDENERAGLKGQYISKIDSSIEKYSIENLFEKLPYEIFEPELFALYAATDAFMTYKLYEWQKTQFELASNKNLYNLFMTVEMPVIIPIAEMELTGVCIDKEYSSRLSNKYNKKLYALQDKIEEELLRYKKIVDDWRNTKEANEKKLNASTGKYSKSKSEQLDWPVNTSSPTQLAILIYDVLKLDAMDKKSPRGTGEEILIKLSEKYSNINLFKLILEQRGLLKLINTYIEKLPLCVSEKDNRLHAHFNQIGADTGRLSSSEPNLQNIPSHNNEIRMMFVPSDGYVFVGGDYSQQEPRILSQYSQDENMIGAYKNGKDLYATIACKVYHNNYADNLEFDSNGNMQPEGKKRRTSVKSLLLGIMYGMGVSSIAEKIKSHDGETTKKDIEEAQVILDGFFAEFPKVKAWIDKTHDDAKKYGYVEDLWGRRRRLPDIQKEKLSIKIPNTVNYNPILFTKNKVNPANTEIIDKYRKKYLSCKSNKERQLLRDSAKSDGVVIEDNGGFIAQAERQCVNARVQGGAATMSKKAMINAYNDEELRRLGFRLQIAVHDELIGECPVENAEEVKKRLSEVMISSALPECEVPMKCDVDDFYAWYEDVYSSDILKEYNKLINDMSHDKAIDKLCELHEECTREKILSFIEK